MDAYAFVLAILFLTVVAPVWLTLHYRAKRREGSALSEKEARDLGELARLAETLEGRVQTLERILDSEAPGWRAKVREG